MSVWQIIRYMLAIAAQSVGALYLALAVWFAASYYVDSENHLRHEYMIGVWVGLMQSAGFSLGSALLASTLKGAITKRAFRVLTAPALVIGTGFLILYFGSLAYDLASRT